MSGLPEDYLHVDERRLGSGVARIAGSTTACDKVPACEAPLTLAGQAAEPLQQRFGREPSTKGKITLAREHLFDSGRGDVSRSFGEDIYHAWKIVIPKARIPHAGDLPKVRLRIAERGLGLAHLLEDHLTYDGEAGSVSGLSALGFVLHHFALQTPATGAATDRDDLDPVGFFTRAGAIIGSPCKIQAMYRKRIYGVTGPLIACPFKWFGLSVATVAHAISIADAA